MNPFLFFKFPPFSFFLATEKCAAAVWNLEYNRDDVCHQTNVESTVLFEVSKSLIESPQDDSNAIAIRLAMHHLIWKLICVDNIIISLACPVSKLASNYMDAHSCQYCQNHVRQHITGLKSSKYYSILRPSPSFDLFSFCYQARVHAPVPIQSLLINSPILSLRKIIRALHHIEQYLQPVDRRLITEGRRFERGPKWTNQGTYLKREAKIPENRGTTSSSYARQGWYDPLSRLGHPHSFLPSSHDGGLAPKPRRLLPRSQRTLSTTRDHRLKRRHFWLMTLSNHR